MFTKFTKCKVVGDIFLVLVAFVPTIYLEVYGTPAKGDFSCSDVSIQHTFNGETYPCWTLLVIAFPVPIVFILLTETITKGSRYRTLTTYLFGLFTSVSLMEVLKFTVGRPRPVFMEWCDPRFEDQTDCGNSTNQDLFKTDYWCENTKHASRAFRTVQSTLSFPSGHASISVYALTYLALYLHFRMSSQTSLLFRHFLQVVCVTLAASISVSRVTDHMHFWSDVVVGILIGVSFAVWIVFCVSDVAKARQGNLNEEVSSEV